MAFQRGRGRTMEDDLGDLEEIGAPKPKAGRLSARNNAQETSKEETEFHEQGGRPAPTPESVAYHPESERCDGCEYYGGGDCSFLEMPVDAGGHCQRFETAEEDQGQPTAEEQNG
jgi:hypothetical protein